jgi:hypothetical protein
VSVYQAVLASSKELRSRVVEVLPKGKIGDKSTLVTAGDGVGSPLAKVLLVGRRVGVGGVVRTCIDALRTSVGFAVGVEVGN